MVQLPQEDESLDYKEQLSSQHNKSSRVHAAYLTKMKIAYVEERSTRNIIHTNEQGVIIGLSTKWHRAVKSLAKRENYFKLKNYNEHPLAWSIVLNKIQ